MRILVTGSRTWTDAEQLNTELAGACRGRDLQQVIVVHGACPKGADRLAVLWVRRFESYGITEEPHPADWHQHTRDCPQWHFERKVCARAGIRRNAEMVAAGADLCLAFIHNQSRGATHCADLAEKAGIPVRRFTECR